MKVKRFLDRVANTAGQRRGIGRVLNAGLDDGKLVTSHPRDSVDLANTVAQAFRDGFQKLVADLIPSVSLTLLKWSRSR
jgi:hypothetical protein